MSGVDFTRWTCSVCEMTVETLLGHAPQNWVIVQVRTLIGDSEKVSDGSGWVKPKPSHVIVSEQVCGGCSVLTMRTLERARTEP